MNRHTVWLAIAAGLLLGGCAAVNETLNKIPGVTVGPASERETGADSSTQAVLCEEDRSEIVQVPGVDVDTAYVRLKRFFDYPTRAERERRSGGGVDSGFRHETTPGARYWMQDRVDFKVGALVDSGWLSTEVERDGDGSVIRLEYCLGGSEGFTGGTGFPDFLNHKVRRVVEGLDQ